MAARGMHIPTCFRYDHAVRYMISDQDTREDVIPMIVPNWDHSPRSGTGNIMFRDCTPKAFGKLVYKAMDAVKDKDPERQIIFIKSWNEWGEGNHMEPDLRYGRGYLETLKRVRDELQM